MTGRPFARVYYVDLERDYPHVFRDPVVLGTYVRLLSVADAMWPARPELPRSVKASCLRVLEGAGLVIRDPRQVTYRVKGLDAERDARSNAASTAARTRWGNADGNAASNALVRATSPDQSRPVQPMRSAMPPVVDERDLPEEAKKAMYAAAVSKKVGLKS